MADKKLSSYTAKAAKPASLDLLPILEWNGATYDNKTITGSDLYSDTLIKSNNLSDLTNTTTARTNLGLGTLATQSGTFSGTSSGTNTGDQIISDATITTTDITTNNFSTTKHGFVPKGTNVGNYLKDDGTWAAVSGGGGASGIWGVSNSSGVYTYYATYQLAVAAATSGQTIEMFGSITESTANHILKNGVNINYNGYTLTFTTGFGIIDNNVACEVQLLNGEVKKGVSGQNVITVTNSGTIIRGNVLVNSSVAGSSGLYGPATVYGLQFKGYDCLYLYSASVKGKAYGVTINSVGGVAIGYGEIYNSVINSTAVSGYAIQYVSIIANCSGIINGCISFYMQGTQIRNSSFTNLTSSTCTFASQDDNFIDNCYFRCSASVFATGNAQGKGLMSNTKISGATYLWHAAGYIINMDKCTLISDTYWNFYLSNGATFNFCTFIVRDTVNSFEDLVSGTVKLNNCKFQLFNAAAYPVYGASAKNFTASNNTYNTTNFQLNMTNLQTYTADSVGNQRLN